MKEKEKQKEKEKEGTRLVFNISLFILYHFYIMKSEEGDIFIFSVFFY